MNKTIFVSLALLMLMIGTAIAETPDVKCNIFGTVCSEKNVQKAVNELSATDQELDAKVSDVKTEIETKESAWLKDMVGGGISRHSVEEMLINFIETLKEHFATVEKLEKAEKRMDLLEARLNILERGIGGFASKGEVEKESKEIFAKRQGLTTCNEIECYFITTRD